MTIYRYPPRAVVGDYLRSFAGLTVGIAVLTQASLSHTVTVIFSLQNRSIEVYFLTYLFCCGAHRKIFLPL